MNSQSSPEDQALEIEFRAELNLARRVRVGDLPRGAIRGRAGIVPIRAIKCVECVRLEHQAHPFSGQVEHLPQ